MSGFLFRGRFFIFGSFGELFCQMTFTVTVKLRFCLVLTKLGGDVVVIDDVIQNRQYRLQEYHQCYGYDRFFHGAKVIAG